MSQDLKEIVDSMNRNQLTQEEDIQDIIHNFIDGAVAVSVGLDTVRHRWFTTGTTVFNIKPTSEYIGVRQVIHTHSVDTQIDEIGWVYEFMQMKKVETTTYKPHYGI